MTATPEPVPTLSTLNPAIAGDPWRYELHFYLWATEAGGEALGRDFTISFNDIIENLNFALMGGLSAYKGKWMTYGELIYADIRQDSEKSYKISREDLDFDIKVDAVADADIQTTVVNFGAGYKMVETPTYRLYGTFGVRYLELDSQLTLNLNKRSFDAESSDSYWDAVVGLNGRAAINDRWFVPFVLDVGTGQSDLTWQAAAGVGYSLGRSDIVVGYRYMDWDLPDDDLVTEYYMAGPMIMWNYRF
ncbi:hypothetical protein [Tropicimonas sp. IMCC34043]|uniref:hypothetical protein n=1 Tax=Tropicimonas sp. IMCC34043 TaxID=2248760 RepID=UPI000E22BF67|nr:hypothetical protein [Tropicimonas sp. IMCC34043]